MAKENDKKRPIEERIAALMGRSAFCDIRDGFGGSRTPTFSDQDVAAALGMVATVHGKIACQVLETHYGSTLLHLEALLRAWEEREYKPSRPHEEIVLTRFGAELAIRELASVKFSTPQLAHYAYLIVTRRERLQQRVEDAARWLHSIRDQALTELRACAREVREHRLDEAA
ncbi:hypothetical protein [Lysobacter sp. Root96]|uniref:hypothetical protein n=1 Tax=Lysobacter sp. Root96 TaxID=1736612 RepID=UPI0006FD7AF9|nr:hypothetical protein [Lysobacter sp. Root96]KRD71429.1 hypothetical protein ASE45_06360 [Lysobacter sp. Root96]